MEFNYEMLEQQESQTSNQANPEEGNFNVKSASNKQKDEAKTVKKKEALTPERLAELRKIAPEINWEADTVMTEGEAGMTDAVDVVSPALRFGKK